MAKPEREFSAVVGQKSMGTAGPEYIKKDLDKAFAMLDPNKTLPDGSPGGIGLDNMQQGAVNDEVIGNREIDDTQAPIGNIGFLSTLLNWIAYVLKSILGTSWRTTPAITLPQVKAHVDAPSPHTEHETKTGAQAKVDAHGDKKDNPHNVSAEQVGAIVSVDGVSNPGGNIDLVAGAGVDLTPDNVGKKITISAKNDSIIPGKHATTHGSGGSDPVTPASIGAATSKHATAHGSGGSDPVTPASIGAETPAGAQNKVNTHEAKAAPHSGHATKAEVDAAKKHNLTCLARSIGFDGSVSSLAQDEDFVYIVGPSGEGLYKAYKLNKIDLSTVAESDNYGGRLKAITIDEDFVYIGGDGPKKVYKLNKSDLSKVAESPTYGGVISALVQDENFIYVGGATTQKVFKLNKSDLSKVAESSILGETYALTQDESFIYVGEVTTDKVHKLHKSDLSVVVEGSEYGASIWAIAQDENFVYVGGDSGKIHKLDKTDLSKVAESISYMYTIRTLVLDENYIYIGGITPRTVYKLDKTNFSKVAEYSYRDAIIYALVLDDNFVYVASHGDYIGKVHKLLNIITMKN